MKTSQNVRKMTSVTQAERRRRHWLMAAATVEWSSFLHSTNYAKNFLALFFVDTVY